MTETFEEYLNRQQMYETNCCTCDTFLCYNKISNDELAFCLICTKSYYEENEK